MRSRCARTTSTGETALVAIIRARSVMEVQNSSATSHRPIVCRRLGIADRRRPPERCSTRSVRLDLGPDLLQLGVAPGEAGQPRAAAEGLEIDGVVGHGGRGYRLAGGPSKSLALGRAPLACWRRVTRRRVLLARGWSCRAPRRPGWRPALYGICPPSSTGRRSGACRRRPGARSPSRRWTSASPPARSASAASGSRIANGGPPLAEFERLEGRLPPSLAAPWPRLDRKPGAHRRSCAHRPARTQPLQHLRPSRPAVVLRRARRQRRSFHDHRRLGRA